MQAVVGLLVADVMPIYMIIPRYSHNYAQFCQLLNSNSFTHRKICMLLREATSEIYGPRVYLYLINLRTLYYCFCFFTLLLFYFASLSQKYQKYYHIISIGYHFRMWPWRDWQPLYCIGCEVLICLCRCVGLEHDLLLDWYLGSQKLREILTLLCCITLSS